MFQIPEGMEIENLKEKVIAIIANYRIQVYVWTF